MCVLYFFAFLMSCGALYNAFRGDWGNVKAGLGFAFVLAFVGALIGLEESRAEEFQTWLLDNKTALLDGQILDYRGQPIALDTPLTRYFAVIGFLIASAEIPSRHVVRKTGKARGAALLCGVTTLLLGWWSLPTGPLEVIAALGKNARGGQKTDVARLLNELVKAQPQAN